MSLLTTTPNREYRNASKDLTLRFTNDQGEFVIIGDDEKITDDEIMQLFESEFDGIPEGWQVVEQTMTAWLK